MLRALIAERMDPVLFGYSYDYVGDLAETVSLVWPTHAPEPEGRAGGARRNHPLTLGDVVEKAAARPAARTAPNVLAPACSTRSASRPASRSSSWSPAACGSASRRGSPSRRWPISAVERQRDRRALARADAALRRSSSTGSRARAEKPRSARRRCSGRSCCPMRSRTPTSQARACRLCRRMEMGRHPRPGGRSERRRAPALFAHRRRRFAGAFPTSSTRMNFDARARRRTAGRRGRRSATGTFSDLQQRLNRKSVSPKMREQFPASCAATTCCSTATTICAALPFTERRARLQAFSQRSTRALRPLAARSPSPTGTSCSTRRCARTPPASGHRRRDAQAAPFALSCRAGRKVRGSSGSAIRTRSMPC